MFVLNFVQSLRCFIRTKWWSDRLTFPFPESSSSVTHLYTCSMWHSAPSAQTGWGSRENTKRRIHGICWLEKKCRISPALSFKIQYVMLMHEPLQWTESSFGLLDDFGATSSHTLGPIPRQSVWLIHQCCLWLRKWTVYRFLEIICN